MLLLATSKPAALFALMFKSESSFVLIGRFSELRLLNAFYTVRKVKHNVPVKRIIQHFGEELDYKMRYHSDGRLKTGNRRKEPQSKG